MKMLLLPLLSLDATSENRLSGCLVSMQEKDES